MKGALKSSTKVAGLGAKKAPAVSIPRLKGAGGKKPKNTRIYSKGVAKQDPGEFTGVGFGNTALTGED